MIPNDAKLLMLYMNSDDKWHGSPLYRVVVDAARRLKLAGASVFPVEVGYGSRRRIHDLANEYTSFDIPIVVEVVDGANRVAHLAGELETIMSEGLLVINSVEVLRYTHASESGEFERSAITSSGASLANPISGKEVSSPMKIEGEAKRVTIYLGSADTWHGRNLAVAIVERCRAMGIAGATVSRGIMGFGKQSVIHRAHLLGLSEDLPEKIEVVDRPEQIARLLPIFDEMVGGGLIVVEDVHVVRYQHDPKHTKGAL